MKYSSYLASFGSDLPKEVYILEQQEMITSKDVFFLADYDEEKLNPYAFLYHGVRFDEKLEKFEEILKCKKILAGKYTNNYFNYSDNANMGEYVSMTLYNRDRNSAYDVFVKENICFLISPDCDAILTKYIDFNTWEIIKNKKTKNIYSYMEGEFFCKDYVAFEFVKAIGVPYSYLIKAKGKEYADDILTKVGELMKKYKINLKVVDTGSYNTLLIDNKIKKNNR